MKRFEIVLSSFEKPIHNSVSIPMRDNDITRTAMINGKEVYYDVCDKNILDLSSEFILLGNGYIYKINGIEQPRFKNDNKYFWVRINK